MTRSVMSRSSGPAQRASLSSAERQGVPPWYAAASLLMAFAVPQFRDGDLVQPEIGAVVDNVPTMPTGNPLGSLVLYGSYHVAANVHTYRSDSYLPPDLIGYAERGSGSAGLALAAAWVTLAGCVIYLERRRLFPSAEESP